MTTLKTLRTRKTSVQSTQKITMAMKMVAAAKLRRAHEELEAGRPYALLMYQILHRLAQRTTALDSPQPLLTGTGRTNIHLILLATSDRGLCGAFNSSLIKYARQLIREAQNRGETVKIFCIGRKAKTAMEKDYKDLIIETVVGLGYPRLSFKDAKPIAQTLVRLFEEGVFDLCTLIYNRFHSALKQEVQAHQIIPFKIESSAGPQMVCEYEPNEGELLSRLLHQNVVVQVYNALSENAASEEGARMAAMENASRNAEDMIGDLTLTYNRTRQACITRELIEIISGAEAL
jgi:F-type H+-transporting ATPase subunit gamma